MKPSVAFNALNSSRLVEATDITTNVIRLSDGMRDDAGASTGVGFLRGVGIRIVSIRSRAHLYGVGHSE